MKNDKPVEELKNRLTTALALNSMRPIDLAEKTGISKSTISQYMSGYANPKQNNIYKICQALNVSEAWLMGFDVPQERQDTKNSGLTQEDRYLINIMHQLSSDNQDMMVHFADMLLNLENERK